MFPPKWNNVLTILFQFVDDFLCIMDHAKVDAGICMGNDFGAQVCWEAGRMRPDRFIGIFNAVVPVS